VLSAISAFSIFGALHQRSAAARWRQRGAGVLLHACHARRPHPHAPGRGRDGRRRRVVEGASAPAQPTWRAGALRSPPQALRSRCGRSFPTPSSMPRARPPPST